MFRQIAKDALLLYATRLPYHRGKWRVVERSLQTFGIEEADAQGTFSCLRQGLRWELDTRCSVQRRLYYHGALDPYDEREFLRRIKPGDVMLDIGSYFGYYGLQAAKREAKVFAFEPAAANFADLCRQRGLNEGLDVTPVQLALADTAGRSRMSVAGVGQRGTGQIEAGGGEAEAGLTEEIETETLDAFAAANGIERIDAVKLDVEGAESRVLAGGAQMFSKCKPLMLMEYNPKRLGHFGVSGAALLEQVRGLGYRLMRSGGRGLEEFRGLKEGEEYCNVVCLPEAK